MLSKVHIKKKAGFKPTEKMGGGGATGATAQIQSALMNRLTSLTKRFNQATLPQLYQPQVAPAGTCSAMNVAAISAVWEAPCLNTPDQKHAARVMVQR
jgi:hypothetical protein